MGLHPAFFTLAILGLAAAVLGIYEYDTLVRDAGIVFAITTIAVGLVWESEAVKTWRKGRSTRVKVDASKVKEESGFAALADSAPSPAPSGEVVRPPYGKVAQAWEADFTITPQPAAPAPAPAVATRVVQPTTIAVPAGVPARYSAPPAPAAAASAGPERLTRGMCGKCQSPITVSSRRPIRVTCPMCNHSKILQ